MLVLRSTFAEYKREWDRKLLILKEDLQRSYDNKIEKHKVELKKVKDEAELSEKKLVAAYDDKLAKELNKMKEDYEEKITRLKQEHLNDKHEFMEKHLQENYGKLSDSLAKLHEEGNATTKFVKDFALKSMENMGQIGQQSKISKLAIDIDRKGK